MADNSYTDIMEKNHMEIPWHDYARQDGNILIDKAGQIEKELPMAYVFYGQDSLVENDKRYDEIGIFLRSSHFLKNLEKHVQKAEAIIYGR